MLFSTPDSHELQNKMHKPESRLTVFFSNFVAGKGHTALIFMLYTTNRKITNYLTVIPPFFMFKDWRRNKTD